MRNEFLTVRKENVAERLDVFIAAELEDISRSRVKSIVEAGEVTVNGVINNKSGYAVKDGDEITVTVPEPEVITAEPQNLPIDIVYQDNDLAVINKAQGMVTHPATGSPDNTLVNAIMYHIKDLSTINGVIRPGIVHRLDKDTSGLIVIAKNDAAHNSLAKQIAEKSARRSYVALVDGNVKEDGGVIEEPIGRSRKDRKKMAVVDDGRYAKTVFRVVERFGLYTLVEFDLYTGRTHQIRVHSAYLHHPIVGDELYGGSNKFKLNGQLLHAYKLSFTHPVTGEKLEFIAEKPSYFNDVLKKLRANNQ